MLLETPQTSVHCTSMRHCVSPGTGLGLTAGSIEPEQFVSPGPQPPQFGRQYSGPIPICHVHVTGSPSGSLFVMTALRQEYAVPDQLPPPAITGPPFVPLEPTLAEREAPNGSVTVTVAVLLPRSETVQVEVCPAPEAQPDQP